MTAVEVEEAEEIDEKVSGEERAPPESSNNFLSCFQSLLDLTIISNP
jgi:hypothetical protein